MRKLYAFLFITILFIVAGTSRTGAQSCTEDFDAVVAPALPAGWSATTNVSCGASLAWVTTGAVSDDPPNSAFSNNPNCVSDEWLDSKIFAITSSTAQLTFRRNIDMENGFDGMVLEISIGGGPFQDILTAGGSFVAGAYNGSISVNFGNPLAGRQAWTGNSGGFVTTTVNLPASANGQNVVFRWRRGTDSSVSDVGVYIDGIEITGCGIIAIPCAENFDGVVAPALPLNWTASTLVACGGSLAWVTTGAVSDDPPNSAFTNNPNCVSDEVLVSRIFPIVSPTAQLSFRRSNDMENGFDGLVLEISIGGGPFQDILTAGGSFVAGAYNGNISVNFGNPLAGRQAWTGNSGGFVTTTVNLPASANGQNVVFRWRRGTDSSVSDVGCWIDGITISGSNCGGACVEPAVTLEPLPATVCAGQDTSFHAEVDATPAANYQWQVNTGSGFVNMVNAAPFAGTNTNTLIVDNPGVTHHGYIFRMIALNACGADTTNEVVLTVNAIPTVNVAPDGQCAPVGLTASGDADSYSWSPATALSGTTGASVTANPNVTTVYTVTGSITATGCTNSANVSVLGTPPDPVVTPSAPVICQGDIQALSIPTTEMSFSNTSLIEIPFGAPGTTSGPALPYASTISVSGLPATGVRVKSVTLNGVAHTFPDDMDVLLQSPTGTNVVLMSDVGGSADLTGQNFSFDDAAAALMADGALNPSGTYRPTNYGTPENWVAPGPGSVNQPNPQLASFTGNMNGNWGLYIVDDVSGDHGSMAGWSITFEVATAVWSPATGLYTDPAATVPYVAGTFANPVYASPASTTMYTVTSTLGTCSATAPATVTVTVNPRPTISVSPVTACGPVTLTASGNSNTYSWSPAAGLSATTGASVTAAPLSSTVYTVTGTFTSTGCTNTATATVNTRPSTPVVAPASVTICVGAVTPLTAASGSGSANASSGTINVSIPDNNVAGANHVQSLAGVPAGASVTGIRVNFTITHTFDGDLRINLKAPNGNVLNLVNRRGSSGNDFTGTTISSTAVTPVSSGTAPFSGTYLPDGVNAVGPTGFVSNVTSFNNLVSILNGDWTLAIQDAAGGDVGTLVNWSITVDYSQSATVWSPAAGLYLDNAATMPYVAGTEVNAVYASPASTTTYSVIRASATCNSLPATVEVTVLQNLTVTTQPANRTVCAGASATFSVVTGGNFPAYQWQVSTDGGANWTDIAGASSASLVINNVALAMDGNRYRVVVSNSCSMVTSNAAILTVNDPTPPAISPLPARICLSDTLVGLTGLPIGGSWSGIGISGNNFVPSATAVGSYTLTYTYRNQLGCTSTSSVVAKVEDCPERLVGLDDNALELFPNPNTGRFNIRVNSTLYNYMGMKVYDVTGRLLRTQHYGGLVYGRVLPIDLSNLPGGTYMVKFYYDDGVRSADKTFKVIIAR